MPRTDYILADGSKAVGVTTVISRQLGWNKEGLIAWASRRGKKAAGERDEAAEIGTLAHARIAADLGAEAPDPARCPPDHWAATDRPLEEFRGWRKRVSLEVELLEAPLISEAHRLGGTPDMIAVVDGARLVVDVKSGRAIYDESKIQGAAYAVLWEEKHPDKLVDGLLLLHVPRDGRPLAVHTYTDLAPARDVFLHCLALHRLQTVHFPRKT